MTRRLFVATVGLGCGLALGIYITRRAEKARRSLGPEHLANRAVEGAGGLVDRVAAAMDAGRRAAAAREAELRERYLSAP